MQNACLVTTQSFKRGRLDTRTWKHSLLHQLFMDILFFKTYLCHQLEKNLLLNEFNNTMDKQAVKVVKRDETVSQLPCKFSRIVWYFLAHSGEISAEVIGRRRCRRMEVPWQFEFNCSNKVKRKLLKELLVSKSRV